MRKELKEKCGVFGICYPGHDEEVPGLTYLGLMALQHRGQEGTGIVTTDGSVTRSIRGRGLVSGVYNEENLALLAGVLAVGHNQYGTHRVGNNVHSQPVIVDIDQGKKLAFAHNGNLPTVYKLSEFCDDKGIGRSNKNDSELMAEAIGFYMRNGACLEEAINEAIPLFTGSYSCVVMTRDKMVAFREGLRPLSIGRLNDSGIVFASESCALNSVRSNDILDVEPGVLNTVGIDSELESTKLDVLRPNIIDAFEYVYFARPDSEINGISVMESRKSMGIILAEENIVKADVVIGVPDSGIPAAVGFSQGSNIPFGMGLVANRYVNRTFIRPAGRLTGVQMKLNVVKGEIEGKSVVVVDDSIVRGNTAGPIVQLLRDAGAVEVHVRIASPPVKYPDFTGIDTPKQLDLIAARMSIAEIGDHIGADSLSYLSVGGLVSAIGLGENMSTHAFDGKYPSCVDGRLIDEMVRYDLPIGD